MRSADAGYTLLESLIALSFLAILGAMIYSFFGTMITRSSDSVTSLQEAFDLQMAMERITSDYYAALNGAPAHSDWLPATPYTVGDQVVSPTQEFGHVFICAADGVSDTVEPPWTSNPGDIINDGTAAWEVGLNQLAPLQNAIVIEKVTGLPQPLDGPVMEYTYGRYSVLENNFIKFVGNNEAPATTADPRNTLKVKLKNERGETLIALFTTTY